MTRKIFATTLTAVALGLAPGCNKEFKGPNMNADASANYWTVTDLQKDMSDGAIVRQAVIYPYHFAANSARLNDLGERDMEVLSRYYAANPGKLSVRRDETADALYAARVQAVRDSLAAHGVAPARIAIDDGNAGGEGIVAERVVRVLSKDPQPLENTASTRSSVKESVSRSVQTTSP